MRDVLVRFLTLQPLNEHPIIPWGMLIVWVCLVGNCVASIRAQPWGFKARLAWLFAVVLIPVAGMAAYLSVCLVKADYTFLKFVLGPSKSAKVPHNVTLRLPTKTV